MGAGLSSSRELTRGGVLYADHSRGCSILCGSIGPGISSRSWLSPPRCQWPCSFHDLSGWAGCSCSLLPGPAYFFVASLWAAHLIYDQSPLYHWGWLTTTLSAPLRQLVNIHKGFDETSEALQQLFPQTRLTIFDLYNPLISTEPSIARARRYRPAKLPAISVDAAQLPLETSSCDGILLFMAAHEIRTAEGRTCFFAELQRILGPGGQALLVEHLRNLPNALAFGPGCLHFYPRREWRRLIQESGFQLKEEHAITPFVRLFVLQKSR